LKEWDFTGLVKYCKRGGGEEEEEEKEEGNKKKKNYLARTTYSIPDSVRRHRKIQCLLVEGSQPSWFSSH
jgi:hypothetical protein